MPEIRQVVARLLLKAVPDIYFVLAWSRWRRRHQAEAAKSHYRAREKPQGRDDVSTAPGPTPCPEAGTTALRQGASGETVGHCESY